jgi:hypothetical protein
MVANALFNNDSPVIPPLALRPRDAALALGISERLLQDWVRLHGLPSVRLGQVVLHPVDELRRWLRERSLAGEAATASARPSSGTN